METSNFEKLQRTEHLPKNVLKLLNQRELNEWIEKGVLQLESKNIQELDEHICNLPGLYKLNVSSNQLKRLPEHFGKLILLKIFNGSYNQINQLPESFCNLENLEIIELDSNKIKFIKDNLWNKFYKIKKISLAFNEIEKLPINFGNKLQQNAFDQLEELNLHHNFIEEIPDSIGNLIKLKKFNLSANKIEKIPWSFCHLENLEELNLSQNKLIELPEIFGKFIQLKKFFLNKNNLIKIPKSMKNLSNLELLDLSYNQLVHLPNSIGKLKNLTQLNVEKNNLKNLPIELIELDKLTQLKINSNQLKTIPIWLQELTTLKTIETADNPSAHEFSNEFQIFRYQIKLTDELSLSKILDLSEQSISKVNIKLIEKIMDKYPKINIIDFSKNLLDFLPFQLIHIPTVEDVLLADNRLLSLPDVLRLHSPPCWRDIKSYLATIFYKSLHYKRCKLMIIGDANVGKTTLVKALLSRDGKTSTKNRVATDGISVTRNSELKVKKPIEEPAGEENLAEVELEKLGASIELRVQETQSEPLLQSKPISPRRIKEEIQKKRKKKEKKKDSWRKTDSDEMKFDIWDFGGQEIFYPTHQFFLTTGCSIYLVVFKITIGEKTDFSKVEYWMKMLNQLYFKEQNIRILLVGTHCDMLYNSNSTPNEIENGMNTIIEYFDRIFTRIKYPGKVYPTMLISNKTSFGIDALKGKLIKLGKEISTKIPPNFVLFSKFILRKQKIRERMWLFSKNSLTHQEIEVCEAENDHLKNHKKPKKFNFISKELFYKWLRICGITSEQECKNALEYFKSIGNITYLHDYSNKLYKFIILNPQWLADMMYLFISLKTTITHRNGIINHSQLKNILKSYSPIIQKEIINWIILFKVLIPLPGNTYLLPLYLPTKIEEQNPKYFHLFNDWGFQWDKAEEASKLNSFQSLVIEEGEDKNIESDDYIEIRREYCFFFNYIPCGLFSHILSRLLTLPNTESPLVWGNGIILHYHPEQFIKTSLFNSSPDISDYLAEQDANPTLGDRLHKKKDIFLHKEKKIRPKPKSSSLPFSRSFHSFTQEGENKVNGNNPPSPLSDSKIFEKDILFEKGFIEFHENVFKLIVRTIIHKDNTSPKLFSECINIIDMTLKIFCSNLSIRKIIICPYCLLDERRNILKNKINIREKCPEIIGKFTLHDCTSAVEKGEFYLKCQNTHKISETFFNSEKNLAKKKIEKYDKNQQQGILKKNRVKLIHLVPDICFLPIKTYENDEIEIVSKIGSGGFGKVYKAIIKDENNKSIMVAIKKPRKINENVKDDTFHEFLSESQIMRELNHPNLVKLYGIIVKPTIGIIMEYLPLGNLLNYLKCTNSIDFPLEVRILICYDISKALHFLEISDYCHRDVRSANILIYSLEPSSPIHAKLSDFGLVRKKVLLSNEIGHLVHQYNPPECYYSSPIYDILSDVYSFAICCWEILSMKFPFDEFNLSKDECIRKISNDHLRPSLSLCHPDTPLSLFDLIKQSWSTDRLSRPSFLTIQNTLRKILLSEFNLDPDPSFSSLSSSSSSFATPLSPLSATHSSSNSQNSSPPATIYVRNSLASSGMLRVSHNFTTPLRNSNRNTLDPSEISEMGHSSSGSSGNSNRSRSNSLLDAATSSSDFLERNFVPRSFSFVDAPQTNSPVRPASDNYTNLTERFFYSLPGGVSPINCSPTPAPNFKRFYINPNASQGVKDNFAPIPGGLMGGAERRKKKKQNLFNLFDKGIQKQLSRERSCKLLWQALTQSGREERRKKKIRCLILENDHIWLGTSDGYIHVYQILVTSLPNPNIEFNEILKEKISENHEVVKLLSTGNEIWSISSDSMISVWDKFIISSQWYVEDEIEFEKLKNSANKYRGETDLTHSDHECESNSHASPPGTAKSSPGHKKSENLEINLFTFIEPAQVWTSIKNQQSIRIWDAFQYNLLHIIHFPSSLLNYHPNSFISFHSALSFGRFVWVCCNHLLILIDKQTRIILNTFPIYSPLGRIHSVFPIFPWLFCFTFSNGCIHIYHVEMNSIRCIHQLNSHRDCISSIIFDKDFIYSCDRSGFIYIWSKCNFNSIQRISSSSSTSSLPDSERQKNQFFLILCNTNLLVSFSSSSTVRFWLRSSQ